MTPLQQNSTIIQDGIEIHFIIMLVKYLNWLNF